MFIVTNVYCHIYLLAFLTISCDNMTAVLLFLTNIPRCIARLFAAWERFRTNSVLYQCFDTIELLLTMAEGFA